MMCLLDIDSKANSVDLHQTALQEQSELDLHCLLTPVYPNTFNLEFFKLFSSS